VELIELEVVAEGSLDENPGFFLEVRVDGALDKTHFWFEEGGYIRYYAWKNAGEVEFQLYPEGTYLVKSGSMTIGDSWSSWWWGEPSVATVVDTQIVEVPSGTWLCYVVQDSVDTVVGRNLYCQDLGLVYKVEFDVEGQVAELASYSPQPPGGSGFFPLAVGNRWEYDASPFTGVSTSTTWGCLKAAFAE
jgi:hypothetical protein